MKIYLESLLLLLAIGLLYPSIALLTAGLLSGLLALQTGQTDGQIASIASIAFLLASVLCFA